MVEGLNAFSLLIATVRLWCCVASITEMQSSDSRMRLTPGAATARSTSSVLWTL